MKKLIIGVTAVLLVSGAAPARAERIPIHDPGRLKPSWQTTTTIEQGEAQLTGTYVERTISVKAPSYVKDTADDGLAVYLWVSHDPAVAGGDWVRRPIASAEGAGVSTPVEWVSPHEVREFRVRVCAGPGESVCSSWR